MRKHRDEISDKLEDLELKFAEELAAKDAKISSVEEEAQLLKYKVKDLEDQIKSEDDIQNDDELGSFGKNLADELRKSYEEVAHEKEIEKLHLDIDEISKVNKIKEEELITLTEENRKLKETISESSSVKLTTCDHCDLTFGSKAELRDHMVHAEKLSQNSNLRAKLASLEREMKEQKVNITSSLFKLKNQEVEKRKVCDCRINRKEKEYCKINHYRNNYVRSKCDELFSKLGNFLVSTDGAKKEKLLVLVLEERCIHATNVTKNLQNKVI